MSWTPPATTGGTPVTGYTATAYPTDTATTDVATCTTTTTTCTLTPLTNGDKVHIAVTATNTVGTSAPSPRQTATPLGTPSVPRDITTTPGDGQVTVSWTPPATTGGTPVTGYTATAYPTDTATTDVATCTTTTTTCTLTPLTNGD